MQGILCERSQPGAVSNPRARNGAVLARRRSTGHTVLVYLTGALSEASPLLIPQFIPWSQLPDIDYRIVKHG